MRVHKLRWAVMTALSLLFLALVTLLLATVLLFRPEVDP